MAKSSPDESHATEEARAEELMLQVGESVGSWASRMTLHVMKAVARAREEAEDVLAEAQSLNRDVPPQSD